MLRTLGKGLFRSWLALLGALLFAFVCLEVAVMKALRQVQGPFRELVADRLLTPTSLVFPALLVLSRDLFEYDADGPGFSDADIPKLWATCRQMAQKMGVPPPDAIHLSLEPGDCCAWASKEAGASVRRHVALSLLDLRLVSADGARAVIAHEIAHAGFDHSQRNDEAARLLLLMAEVAERLWFPLWLPVRLARAIFRAGLAAGRYDHEREADRKAAEVVGGNHAAGALQRILVQAPVLARVFALVRERAQQGGVAPRRLAEAAWELYQRHDFSGLKRRSLEAAEQAGAEHPSLGDRVAESERAPARGDMSGGASFIEAYPELLACEEALTGTYFPDAPVHASSGASNLKRRALAARLKAR
jgi:Zn-dependent protease with chaperone function